MKELIKLLLIEFIKLTIFYFVLGNFGNWKIFGLIALIYLMYFIKILFIYRMKIN